MYTVTLATTSSAFLKINPQPCLYVFQNVTLWIVCASCAPLISLVCLSVSSTAALRLLTRTTMQKRRRRMSPKATSRWHSDTCLNPVDYATLVQCLFAPPVHCVATTSLFHHREARFILSMYAQSLSSVNCNVHHLLFVQHRDDIFDSFSSKSLAVGTLVLDASYRVAEPFNDGS
jgi:hypothetical protein